MKTLVTLVWLALATALSISAQAQSKPAPKPAAKKPVPAAKKPAPAPAGAARPVAKPAAKPAAPATKKPATVAAKQDETPPAPPALVTDKMVQQPTNTGPLKVRAEANPVTKRLTVRTNSSNPTRVEINGPDGRPVITRDLLNSNEVATLDVSNLPAGAYLVQCTSGERRGMKRVMVGR
ncbi:T9SS type A sorting domain-containing protein [Hymenobacter sp. APR13]|uniref:T9SS type A sorting domain-containing protein n=1 Tax=Hymenobacter sp. APR13 TaxID=1356852 RepID=UPI0005C59E14|nr:T9SS type A sorting domain-containing protein [Hymenobacter sp. APR13]